MFGIFGKRVQHVLGKDHHHLLTALGIDPAAFAKIGLPAREIPVCKKSYE